MGGVFVVEIGEIWAYCTFCDLRTRKPGLFGHIFKTLSAYLNVPEFGYGLLKIKNPPCGGFEWKMFIR